MLNLNHKNLDVWKLSISLVKTIYRITEKFPKSEMFGITNQMRRASISITSNIAEGASRRTELDRKRFYTISRSSLVELDTQLEIALMLKFLTEEEVKDIDELLNHLFAKITNLLNKSK